MRIVLAGGGTGGHLFPALALAEEIRARGAEHEILFVGSPQGIEATLVPKHGYRLELIAVLPLVRTRPLALLKALYRLPLAILRARKVLRDFRPDVVVGVGGYASGPVLLAARKLGLPTVILEQNSFPGLTNRKLGQRVDRVFVAIPGSERFFPTGKAERLGNPLRRDITALSERDPEEATSVLVLGGSQGAHGLNNLVRQAVEHMARQQLTGAIELVPAILHQTGKADHAAIANAYAALNLPQVTAAPFIDDMGAAYRNARLVISRAGATTLAEISAIGLPAILVPFPFAADDHQTENARRFVEGEAAVLLPETGLTGETLASTMVALLEDNVRLHKMAEAMKRLGRPDAAARIVDELQKMAAAA